MSNQSDNTGHWVWEQNPGGEGSGQATQAHQDDQPQTTATAETDRPDVVEDDRPELRPLPGEVNPPAVEEAVAKTPDTMPDFRPGPWSYD